MATTADDVAQLHGRLKQAGQEHVLKFWDQLDTAQRAALRAQIEQIDLDALPRLIERYVHAAPAAEDPDRLEPAPFYPRDPADPHRPWNPEAARKAGLALLA